MPSSVTVTAAAMLSFAFKKNFEKMPETKLINDVF
jgi:hypothetical protein